MVAMDLAIYGICLTTDAYSVNVYNRLCYR